MTSPYTKKEAIFFHGVRKIKKTFRKKEDNL